MIRVAFVKYAGMVAGGTERRLHEMATSLPADRFAVDFFWCDQAPEVGSAPHLGGGVQRSPTDPDRLAFMASSDVRLIEFHVGARDIGTPTLEWRDTDFWELFDEHDYDFVQTAKAGPAEYPFTEMSLPVVELVALTAGADRSDNLALSIHYTQWQRRDWWRSGGRLERSTVLPNSASFPVTADSFRDELGIPADAVVAGFHQRAEDAIASPVPLAAFAALEHADRHFVIMGGGARYRAQAAELGLRNAHFIDHAAGAHQISRFLNTLDVFAHGRLDGETFGTVFAEAMGHGLPCLSHASSTGNNAQIETMGPSGLFAWDDARYRQLLETLFVDEALRRRLGRKGEEHARRYFSPETARTNFIALYEHLAAGGIGYRPIEVPYAYMEDLDFLYAGYPEDPGLAHYALVGGVPEAFEVHIASKVMAGATTVLDVGANTGLYCLVAARDGGPTTEVHAYEPLPEASDTLRTTAWLNNWEDRLHVHEVALGDRPGTQDLFDCGTGSSFDIGFTGVADAEARPVTVTTLDAEVERLTLAPVDFVKIDVEGHELAVLEGGQVTIERDHPALFVEVAATLDGRGYRNADFATTIDWLTDRGYRLWRCDGEQARPFAARTAPDGVAMYLCLHPERHAALIGAVPRWVREYRLLGWRRRSALVARGLRMAVRAVARPQHALRYLRVANLTDARNRLRGRL